MAKIKNQAKCLELCGVDGEYCGKVLKLAGEVQSGDPTNVEGQAAAQYFKYLFGTGFSRGQDTLKILVGELSLEEKSADNEQLSIF